MGIFIVESKIIVNAETMQVFCPVTGSSSRWCGDRVAERSSRGLKIGEGSLKTFVGTTGRDYIIVLSVRFKFDFQLAWRERRAVRRSLTTCFDEIVDVRPALWE